MTTLNGTLPELQAAYELMQKYASAHGLTIGIADFGGFRTLADTTKILGYRQADYNAAVAAGDIAATTSLQAFRPIAAYGSSWHDFGAAFDVAIIARPAGMSDAAAFQTLGSYAPSIGLQWGGTFTHPDPDHFQLAIPLADAKARYDTLLASGGLTASGAGGTNPDDLFGGSGDPATDTAFADALSGPSAEDTTGDLASSTTFLPDWMSIALVAGLVWFVSYVARRREATA